MGDETRREEIRARAEAQRRWFGEQWTEDMADVLFNGVPFLLDELSRAEAALDRARECLEDLYDSQRSIFVAWAQWSKDGNAADAARLDSREAAMRNARAFLSHPEGEPSNG